MTSSERAARLAELVKAAVECGPEHWDAFLDEECKSDPAMRAEIDSLLKHQKHVDQFIEPSALHLAANSFLHDGAYRAGQVVEEYQVLSRIGIGGMGEVYLAQDTKLRRKVALKIVRAGMDTSEIVARFRQEEQILASLNHPNIAQLYGAGVAGDDIPFLVMEYIEGVRIDDYCKTKAFSPTARLELFRKVCAAVHYAHQRLIIHRDLKPSNILVTAEGEPKLLDFGIAKLLESQDVFTRMQTTLPGVMTPDYASPEQVRGEAMTTSTDVYSLGVLLYELLTGQRPYRLKTRSADEIARAITDQEPERPSTAIARGDDSSFVIRHSSFPKGDLDNIVLMALRKEPPRRYASVGQFSEDIRRYLEGLPVLAHKDTLSYRATKFIKRNKAAAAAAAIVLLTLLGAIVTTARQARRATEQAKVAEEQARVASAERDRAQAEKAKAERINDFLQNILGFSDPTWTSSNPQRNREATIADALGETGTRAATELADQPEVLAAVHFTLGWTYKGHAKFAAAEQHLRASLDLRRKVLGQDHPDCGQCLAALAGLFTHATKFREAEAAGREAVTIYRRAHQAGKGDSKWFAISLNQHAIAHRGLGNFAEAETLIKEALEIGGAFKGAERAPLAQMMSNLGSIRRDQGDLDGAITVLQNALTEFRKLPRIPHFEVGGALFFLSTVLNIKGEDGQAETVAREAFDVLLGSVGDTHPSTPRPLITLAEIHYKRGDYPAARAEVDRALLLQQGSTPEGHLYFTDSWIVLGKILTRTGEAAQGESYLRRALESRTQALPPGHPMVAEAQGAVGEYLLEQTRYIEAEPLLVGSHTIFNQKLGGGDPRTQDARRLLLKLYEAWGKPEQAAAYRP